MTETETLFVDIGNWDEKRLAKARPTLLTLLQKDGVELYCPDTSLLPQQQLKDMFVDLVDKTDVEVENADQDRIRKTYMTAALANMRVMWGRLPGALRDKVRALAREDPVLTLAVHAADTGTFQFDDSVRALFMQTESESDVDTKAVENRIAELEERQKNLEEHAKEERKLVYFLMKELAKYATEADAGEAEALLHKRSREVMRDAETLYECVRSSKDNVLECRARVEKEDKRRPSRAVIQKARMDTAQLHGKLEQAAVALERLQRERDELLKGTRGFEEYRKTARQTRKSVEETEQQLREELRRAREMIQAGQACNCEQLTRALEEHKKLLTTANTALKQYKEMESRQVDEIKKLKDDLHFYKNVYGDKDKVPPREPRDEAEKIRQLKEEVERERKEKEKLKEKYGTTDTYKDRQELQKKLDDAETRIKRKEEKLLEEVREKEKREWELQKYKKMETEYNQVRKQLQEEEKKRRDFELKYNNYRNKYENLKTYGEQRKRVDRDGRPYSRDLEYMQEQDKKQKGRIAELEAKLLEKATEVKEVKDTTSHECKFLKENYDILKKKYEALRNRYPVFAAALETGEETELMALGLDPIERHRRPLPMGGDRMTASQAKLVKDLYTQMGGEARSFPDNLIKEDAIITPFLMEKIQEVFKEKYPQIVGYLQAYNIIPSDIPPAGVQQPPHFRAAPHYAYPFVGGTPPPGPGPTSLGKQEKCEVYLTDAEGTGIKHILPAISSDRAWAFFYDPNQKRVISKDVMRRDLTVAGDAQAGMCTEFSRRGAGDVKIPNMAGGQPPGTGFVGNFQENTCTIFRVPLQRGRVLYLDPAYDCMTFREAVYQGPLPVEGTTGRAPEGAPTVGADQITLTLPTSSLAPEAYKQSAGTPEELINILRSANTDGISNDEELAQGANDFTSTMSDLQNTIASILTTCK
jgi:hypothetical protein